MQSGLQSGHYRPLCEVCPDVHTSVPASLVLVVVQLVVLDGYFRPAVRVLEELGGGGDGCIAAGSDQLDDDRLGRVCGAALLKGRSHLTVALCCLSICTSMEARAGLP